MIYFRIVCCIWCTQKLKWCLHGFLYVQAKAELNQEAIAGNHMSTYGQISSKWGNICSDLTCNPHISDMTLFQKLVIWRKEMVNIDGAGRSPHRKNVLLNHRSTASKFQTAWLATLAIWLSELQIFVHLPYWGQVFLGTYTCIRRLIQANHVPIYLSTQSSDE